MERATIPAAAGRLGFVATVRDSDGLPDHDSNNPNSSL